MATKKKATPKKVAPKPVTLTAEKYVSPVRKEAIHLQKQIGKLETEMDGLHREERTRRSAWTSEKNKEMKEKLKSLPKGSVYPHYTSEYGDVYVSWRIKGNNGFSTYDKPIATKAAKNFLKEQKTKATPCATFKDDLKKLMKQHGITTL